MSGRRGILLLMFVAVTGVCAWLAVFCTPVVSDVGQFLSQNDETGRFISDVYASVASRLILIGLQDDQDDQDDTERAHAETSRDLAETLRASGRFVRVVNSSEQLNEGEQRALFAHRYLLSPSVTPERFTEQGLREALLQRLRELRSPASALTKQLLAEDPTGELLSLLSLWLGGLQQPETHLGVWFSPDHGRALLLAETKASVLDSRAQADAVATIKEGFARVRDNRSVSLLLAGPGVLASASERIIRDEATLLSIGSTILLVVLLLVSYRSPRIMLLSMLAPASAVCVAAAAVGMVFGGIHGITLGFGCTLLGVAVDYPIHLLSRMRPDETADETLPRIWSTLRLCAITTAIGYLPMVSRDMPSLTQLAVFSIAGLATTLAVTRWVLPQLLPAEWRPPAIAGDGLSRFLAWRASNKHKLTVVLVVLAAFAGLAWLAPPRWEDDVATLSPIPRSLLAVDERLRADLGAPEAGQMIVVRAPSAEDALQKSEAIAAKLSMLVVEGALAGFEAPSTYLPSQQTQRAHQSALPDRERLQAELTRAQAGLPFRPDLFAPFIDAVEATRTGALLGPQDLAETPIGLRVGSLLLQRDESWTALLPLKSGADPTRIVELVRSLDDPKIRYINLRAETNRLLLQVRNDALIRLGGSGVLLTLALYAVLRSPASLLAVLLPVPLALFADLVVLSLLGQRVSLFHLVSLLLVVGTTNDYSLFFNRADPDPINRKQNCRALLLCWATTVAGFGLLSLSSLYVLKAIGSTLTIGVTAGLLFAALLAVPDLPQERRSLKTGQGRLSAFLHLAF